MPKVATIGVYGWNIETFLAALSGSNVAQVIDVRQRRAVRGREYAWANSQRLQHALAEAQIEYVHAKELAPTTELRHVQYAEDARQGTGKRSRVVLSLAYRERYLRAILDQADLGQLIDQMPANGLAALLCVERDPEACHRSLIAERLAAEYRAVVTHLLP